jgi:hypothetical protein
LPQKKREKSINQHDRPGNEHIPQEAHRLIIGNNEWVVERGE